MYMMRLPQKIIFGVVAVVAALDFADDLPILASCRNRHRVPDGERRPAPHQAGRGIPSLGGEPVSLPPVRVARVSVGIWCPVVAPFPRGLRGLAEYLSPPSQLKGLYSRQEQETASRNQFDL